MGSGWYTGEVFNSRTPEYRKGYAHNHYVANKAAYLDRAKNYKKQIKAIVDDLKSQPCQDCKHTYPPICMDFDHRDPMQKKHLVSVLTNQGRIKALREEVAKCDLVCSNCHRIRTAKQALKGPIRRAIRIRSRS
jgi:hypothetical protein